MADLRSRIAAAAIAVARDSGQSADGHDQILVAVDELLDAVMPLVDAVLHHATHEDGAKCRWCRRVVNEAWAEALGKEIQPHRMTCRFYAGPVEHRTTGSSPMFIGYINNCSCGDSWRDAEGGCPNSSETWRGPAASISQLSDQSISTTEGSS